MATKRKSRQQINHSMNNLLSRMPITGYMKFNLDSADDSELFNQTVECTGDFADPIRRGYILRSPRCYKFAVTLCDFSGVVLSDSDYYITEPIDYFAFEQVIREFVNEQAHETDLQNKNICTKHSTVKLSVYNPNHKEHL